MHAKVASCGCPFEDGYELLDNPKLCVKAFGDKKPIEEARKICQDSGAMLIVSDTDEKNTAVSEYVRKTLGTTSYFIGLTDERTEGMYIWENGNVLTFSKWSYSQPDNKKNRDCVMATPSSWISFICNSPRAFVCEKQI
ncbi:alpha-N-acetylgalactosamine-specific lectin-like [Gigantopelta aegis]|uniref:alpha-N-acetylgalactosamine-specific lectin-like n=1 Tax=Gigantopelta aegis TaxID=1735272 RepID=UPI001B88CA5A|nr:alpha-N-acetylgalactosamine-specific lectin-like [Gigantopelta aegis]